MHQAGLYRDTRSVWTRLSQSWKRNDRLARCAGLLGSVSAGSLILISDAFGEPPLVAIPLCLAAAGFTAQKTSALWRTSSRKKGAARRNGNDMSAGEIVDDDDLGAKMIIDPHALSSGVTIFGTTGSGKTHAVFSMVDDLLSRDGGLAYFDGKGDMSSFRRLLLMADGRGRRDDVDILDFVHSEVQDVPVDHGARAFPPTTFDPFEGLPVEYQAGLLADLCLGTAERDASAPREDVERLARLLMRAYENERPRGISRIRFILQRCGLKSIVGMTADAFDGKVDALDDTVGEEASRHLHAIDGYDLARGIRQAQPILDQHERIAGPIAMWASTLLSVAGRVLDTPAPDVVVPTLVDGRRILMVMLPALGRKVPEVEMLQRLVLASIDRHLASRAARGRGYAPSQPFAIFADETPCSLAMEARALSRSHPWAGLQNIAVFQDTPAMSRENERLMPDVFASSGAVGFMRMEDLGRSLAKMSSGGHPPALGVAVDRLNPLDVKKQQAGDMIWVLRGRLPVRTRVPVLPDCRTVAGGARPTPTAAFRIPIAQD